MVIELRQLRYFVAAAEELHFGRAAQRLHVVAPAVSKQIAKLEHDIGAPLFLRIGGRVQLTETGEVLLGEARQLLQRSMATEDTMQRAIRGERGRVRVGCVELVMLSPLAMAVRNYRRQSPDVDLELEEMTSAPQLEALSDGTLDVAIVVGDGDFGSSFTVRHLLTVAVGIALPTDHRLASRRALTLQDVARDELIMPPREQEPTLHDRRIKLCVDAGFTPNIREERSFRSRLGLVAAGFGVTTVPGIDTETAPEGVVFRRLTGPIAQFNVDILCRTASTGPAGLAFVDYVIDRVAVPSTATAKRCGTEARYGVSDRARKPSIKRSMST